MRPRILSGTSFFYEIACFMYLNKSLTLNLVCCFRNSFRFGETQTTQRLKKNLKASARYSILARVPRVLQAGNMISARFFKIGTSMVHVNSTRDFVAAIG